MTHSGVGLLGNFSKIVDIVYTILVEQKYVFCCDTLQQVENKYDYLMKNKFINRDEDSRYNDLVKLECFLFMKRIMNHSCIEFIEKNVEIQDEYKYKDLCHRFELSDDNYRWCKGRGESNGNYRPPNKSIFRKKVSLSHSIFLKSN